VPATHGFRLSSVDVRFGRLAALHDLSLDISPGERVALVGPSGGGKTTLLRLLNATVRPTAGSVESLGQPLAGLSSRELRELRSRTAFIHQDLGLVPNLRVLQNVIAGRLGRRGILGALRALLRPSRADTLEVHRILERVGIGERLYERTDRLSGGEQQRVAIARALFQQPAALLADEPVSSVDPARARDTVALLADLSAERDLTLCMSLHNLELAREFFPRLVGLRDGRIVFDQPSSDLSDDAFANLYQLDDDG